MHKRGLVQQLIYLVSEKYYALWRHPGAIMWRLLAVTSCQKCIKCRQWVLCIQLQLVAAIKSALHCIAKSVKMSQSAIITVNLVQIFKFQFLLFLLLCYFQLVYLFFVAYIWLILYLTLCFRNSFHRCILGIYTFLFEEANLMTSIKICNN